MSRLIDANEVVKEILAERDKIPRTVPTAPYELGTEKPYHAGDQMRGGIRKALRCIEQAPTVDAVPVAHGRWVEKEKYTFGIMYDCSLCENRILDNGHNWNYCPNCGAKMDLEG